MRRLIVCLVFVVFASLAVEARAQQQLRIQVQNLQGPGGYYFTPLFFGFHDGTTDLYNTGDSAGDNNNPSAIQALAEGGNAAGLASLFGENGLVTSPGGFAGAPVFDPGEITTVIFNASTANRFFSFASMLIPTNDVFFGNDDPTSIEVFSAGGAFNGPIDILIGGSDLLDAGTEVLDASVAAFIPGGSGAAGPGGGPDQNGTIQLLDDGSGTGFTAFNTEFFGQSTVAGTTISTNLSAGSPIARIRITAVPEPSSLAILGLASVCGLAGLRRKRRA